jgi:hypothetical protein
MMRVACNLRRRSALMFPLTLSDSLVCDVVKSCSACPLALPAIFLSMRICALLPLAQHHLYASSLAFAMNCSQRRWGNDRNGCLTLPSSAPTPQAC